MLRLYQTWRSVKGRVTLNPACSRNFSAPSTLDWFCSPAETLPNNLEAQQGPDLSLPEQLKCERLLQLFRTHGHLGARLDPLDLHKPSGLDGQYDHVTLIGEGGQGTIGKHHYHNAEELLPLLSQIYTNGIGYEVSQVEDAVERSWLYETIESMSSIHAAPALQKRMARVLLESETFDHFMGKRFGQVKRYGLEGGESMMIAIDVLFRLTTSEHVVVGMPHRGRLNLMVGLLGYPPEAMFHKLGGDCELSEEASGTADVLSHLSHTGKVMMGGSERTVSILPNSSHLEAINPVHQGVAYALQKYRGQETLPIQIHGDAAFSGQGVVQETLQMSQLAGYGVRGTIHIILNNQLGYTATAELGRSGRCAAAPAKIIGTPILHVNGDRPEEVARAASIALQYRSKFGKDVVIDLICYRRHGHNELDEPSFTQPLMYKAIHPRPTLPTAYSGLLVSEGLLSTEEVSIIRDSAYSNLAKALEASKTYKPARFGLQKELCLKGSTKTGANLRDLEEAALQSVTLSPSFNVHTRLQKHHIDSRVAMVKEGKVDWATAEAMAVGTLLKEGYNVRMSGQDVQRGTFSHRHLVFHDQQTGQMESPLATWSSAKGQLDIHNSHLSEFAILGFEYGVSIADAESTLPIWEAQFGDFFNGGQIIFDAFISSGETKWGLQSGLVVLMPHGYDGTGPEHSSCRLERFLQMSNAPFDPHQHDAPINWHVVHPTTPANYFHMLRRQMLREIRRPLVVASPKTLLRLPAAQSPLEDFSESTSFRAVMDDPRQPTPSSIRRLAFCSGKFYYELEKERASRGDDTMAIVRIEELCPLPTAQIEAVLGRYRKAGEVVWCQEEHRNMGAYSYVAPRLQTLMPRNLKLAYVGRGEAAAPATGYLKLHRQELATIMSKLFN